MNDDRTDDAGPLNGGPIIYPNGNGLFAPGVHTYGDEKRGCDVCQPALDVVRRFFN